MNEKFNKNAKVEQWTKMFLSREEEKGLIVKGPLLILILLHCISFDLSTTRRIGRREVKNVSDNQRPGLPSLLTDWPENTYLVDGIAYVLPTKFRLMSPRGSREGETVLFNQRPGLLSLLMIWLESSDDIDHTGEKEVT